MGNICLLMTLMTFGSTRAQAEALFSYITTPRLQMYWWITGVDDSGYVWLLDSWKGVEYATRIAPNGRKVLNNVKLPDAGCLGKRIVTDRWCNAYYMYLQGEDGMFPKTNSYVARISPSGEVQDYAPWPPRQDYLEIYLDILPGDTLLVIGRDESTPYGNRIAKALISPDGITPVFDALYLKSSALSYLQFKPGYDASVTQWEAGYGLRVSLDPHTNASTLRIFNLRLSKEEKYTADEGTDYLWRDYVWRTYPDIWIGAMTFAGYSENGYCLYIPDPVDSSRTHVIRIGEDGIPIDPLTLTGGGTLSVRPYRRVPEGSPRYVDLKVWKKTAYTLEPDSALVVFWGCDDDGNLYAYRKVKRY